MWGPERQFRVAGTHAGQGLNFTRNFLGDAIHVSLIWAYYAMMDVRQEVAGSKIGNYGSQKSKGLLVFKKRSKGDQKST